MLATPPRGKGYKTQSYVTSESENAMAQLDSIEVTTNASNKMRLKKEAADKRRGENVQASEVMANAARGDMESQYQAALFFCFGQHGNIFQCFLDDHH